MRRRHGQRVHRRLAGVRAAIDRHLPARPGLARQPFGDLVGVVRLVALVIAATCAEGLAIAAPRHLHHDVAVVGQRRHAPIAAQAPARAVGVDPADRQCVMPDHGETPLDGPAIARWTGYRDGDARAVAQRQVERLDHLFGETPRGPIAREARRHPGRRLERSLGVEPRATLQPRRLLREQRARLDQPVDGGVVALQEGVAVSPALRQLRGCQGLAVEHGTRSRRGALRAVLAGLGTVGRPGHVELGDAQASERIANRVATHLARGIQRKRRGPRRRTPVVDPVPEVSQHRRGQRPDRRVGHRQVAGRGSRHVRRTQRQRKTTRRQLGMDGPARLATATR